MRAQIENNGSAQQRLARILQVDDSPIRAKVSLRALSSGKILKTPPKTQGEILQEELAKENLATYGPISRIRNSTIKDFNQTVPASIHERDYHYVGNKDRKEYVQGGIAIYDRAKKLSPARRPGEEAVLGQ